MKPGIFAKTFRRADPDAVPAAVRGHGLPVAHFHMVCTGLPPMPDAIPDALARRVAEAAAAHGVTLAAVSGTFNMIHPDPNVRRVGLKRLRVLAKACPALQVPVITLCTGTRDPEDQWRYHPDNSTPAAWRDLCRTLAKALKIAEDEGVDLAFEPECDNVVDSAEKGRQLLREMQSARLRVVLDPANLFEVATPGERRDRVARAVDLLGDDIIMAHAKDRTADGAFCAAGHGVLDFRHYLGALQAIGFDGPVILHGLDEAEAPGCVAFLRQHLAALT